MKAKVLSFVFITFSESGLFNGLQPIQIQKLFSLFRLNISRVRLQESGLGPALHLPPPESPIAIRPFRMDTTYFDLWQDSVRAGKNRGEVAAANPWAGRRIGWSPLSRSLETRQAFEPLWSHGSEALTPCSAAADHRSRGNLRPSHPGRFDRRRERAGRLRNRRRVLGDGDRRRHPARSFDRRVAA